MSDARREGDDPATQNLDDLPDPFEDKKDDGPLIKSEGFGADDDRE